MDTELRRLETEARDLDTFAKTERDILASMIRAGMTVPARDWERVGRIQLQADHAWSVYLTAGAAAVNNGTLEI